MITSHPHRNYTMVIDIGSYRSHFGLAGEESPQFSTYSRICLDKNLVQANYAVGDYELQENRVSYEIRDIFKQKGNDIYKGFMYDQEAVMQFIEKAILDKLKLSSENLSILFTQDIFPNQGNELVKQREKICEIMFEQFNIFNVCFLKKPILTSLSVAKNNAIVVDSGHTGTRVSLVQDGYTVFTNNVGYGGKTINDLIREQTGEIILPIQGAGEDYLPSMIRFQKQMQEQSIKHSFSSEIIGLYKNNAHKMMGESSSKIQYRLPDGNEVTITRSEICDPFVNYPLYYKKYFNFQDQQKFDYQHTDCKAFSAYRSLATFTLSTLDTFLSQEYSSGTYQHSLARQQFLKNIILTGGNLLFADLSTKLVQSLKEKEPTCQIIAVPIYSEGSASHNSSAFVGGSIVADLPIFQNYWIGQNEWKQAGSKQTNEKLENQNSMVINLSQINKTPDANTVRVARNNLVSKKCP